MFHCIRGSLNHLICSFKQLHTKADHWPIDKIRNFGIVAHVDHGKSTLADRLLEITGLVAVSPSNKQLLDQLPVERERGITVKAQTASMYYRKMGVAGQTHLLNLIDTPGHVDFSYEVSRSLAACDGVVLLVDAQQGVQAQTVANFLLAFEAGLSIIPVINKIDLPKANVSDTIRQINSAFGYEGDEILQVSAKVGTGVPDLLEAIIDRIPCPRGDPNQPLRMLLFDSWYNQYRGVVCLVAVVDGVIQQGDIVCSSYTGNKYEVLEVGLLQPGQVPHQALYTGQVGYVITGMRSSKEAQIGDTLHHDKITIQPLTPSAPAKPMVFAGIYPMDQSEYSILRSSLERLTLNDSSVTVHPDSSSALGQGWRIGFLGLLHMEVFTQRLEEEFSTSVLVTTPSVSYKAILRKDNQEILLLNPSEILYELHPGVIIAQAKYACSNGMKQMFPEKSKVKEFLEPFVVGTLIFPDRYLGKILQLCQSRRGIQQDLLYLDSSRVMLKYLLPLSEVVVDFFDQIKSLSSGYASFDYEDSGYRPAELVKLDILLNGQPVDALSCVVHADKAYTFGKSVCLKLRNSIHRQLYEVAIQASVGGRVIARETVKALRKDVTAKCYGGDITRKMKLLRKQKEGKKKLKRIGNIELSRDAFLSVLER